MAERIGLHVLSREARRLDVEIVTRECMRGLAADAARGRAAERMLAETQMALYYLVEDHLRSGFRTLRARKAVQRIRRGILDHLERPRQ